VLSVILSTPDTDTESSEDFLVSWSQDSNHRPNEDSKAAASRNIDARLGLGDRGLYSR